MSYQSVITWLGALIYFCNCYFSVFWRGLFNRRIKTKLSLFKDVSVWRNRRRVALNHLWYTCSVVHWAWKQTDHCAAAMISFKAFVYFLIYFSIHYIQQVHSFHLLFHILLWCSIISSCPPLWQGIINWIKEIYANLLQRNYFIIFADHILLYLCQYQCMYFSISIWIIKSMSSFDMLCFQKSVLPHNAF